MKIVFRTFCFAIATLLIAYGMLNEIDAVWMLSLFAATPFVIYIVHAFFPKASPGLPTSLRNFGVILIAGFLMVSAQLAHYQFAVADSVYRTSFTTAVGEVLVNPRIVDDVYRIQRGRVLDRNGVEVVGTAIQENGVAARTYSDPSTAYLVGYYSPLMYGMSNLETVYNDELSGNVSDNPIEAWGNKFLHRPTTGNDLILTVDSRLQGVAQNALGNRRGAVVALNPQDGAVLAMVSNPHVDPAKLAVPLGSGEEATEAASSYWQELQGDEGRPFVNRATQGLYPPGSTFKTVTLAAALDSGSIEPTTVYSDTGELNVQGHIIVEQNRPEPVKDNYTLSDGYIYSLNVVFAQVGLTLGPDRLAKYAEQFGFGRDIPFDLPVPRSQVSTDPDFLQSRTGLADTAYGQGQLLVSPLQMALVTSAIANGGEMPRPYLVSEVRSPRGDAIYRTQPEPLWRAVGTSAAQEVQRAMVRSVQEGYATPAQIPGIRVAGKSGTAEVQGATPHAWFIAYAPAEKPQIAVAVVVENGGGGIEAALPVAKQVIQSYLTNR